ncbi:ferrochelatase [Candidatus Cardinium hertigii]|uniref:ferrochelatase n=1 Tax=Candidatus Cardinium hertigii TaxID=247481 RepID=UPI000D705496
MLSFSLDKIILLPLCAQFSTTTTGLACNAGKKIIRSTKLEKVACKYTCCYYDNKRFIEAHTELLL